MKKIILTIALCAFALCVRADLFGLKYNSYTTNSDVGVPVAAGNTVAAAVANQTNSTIKGLSLTATTTRCKGVLGAV